MKLLDIPGLSQESIDFQTNSSLGKEIEMVLDAIRTKYKKAEDIYDCQEKRTLEKIIFNHTGLNVYFDFNTDHLAATSVPELIKNHVLINDKAKKLYENNDALSLIRTTKESKKSGFVDIKKGKVSGIFSNLTNIIYIGANMFLSDGFELKYTNIKVVEGITIKEYTAFILHEIGHIFVSFEYINRTNTTNQILASVCKTVIDKDNVNIRETIFKEASEILNIDEQSLVKITDLSVLTTVILKSSMDNTVSELGIKEYDETSFEQLADQFATRHGYGRELITGLDKVSKYTKDKNSFSFFFRFTFESFVTFNETKDLIIKFIGLTALSLLVLPFAIFQFYLLFLNFKKFISQSGSKNENYTYDVLKTRFLRIKEQYIQRLKDKNITPEETKNILASIKAMEECINSTRVYTKPLTLIIDFISPSNRKVKNAILLQRQLEELIMNDFFAKSAALSTI